MNNKTISIALLALVSLFILGCETVPTQTTTTQNPGITTTTIQPNPAAAASVAVASNQFAFDYYSRIQAQPGNAFFSPWSISSALAMTYEGARGQTADEMKAVLHFPDNSSRRSGFNTIINILNNPNKPYKLYTANALWAQEDYEFLPEYFSLVEKYYGGKVTNLNFKTETEKSRKTINNWVEDHTNNLIKELIPKGILGPSTRLVLTNAIYFKADWVQQFEKESTYDQDFKLADGSTVSAKMMHQTSSFNYYEADGTKVLEMDYKGNDLSMLVVLPAEGVAPMLTAAQLADYRQNLQRQEVRVSLPKFKFETMYMMADDLVKMGMPTAFLGGEADFSGMDGTRNLFISQVIHKAYVNVDEKGTEAAAATAVITEAMGPNPEEAKIFNADHPFIFVIQEKSTGAILFMGRMSDPTK